MSPQRPTKLDKALTAIDEGFAKGLRILIVILFIVVVIAQLLIKFGR